MNTVELYQTVKQKESSEDELLLVTKYHMPNSKCLDIVAPKLPLKDDGEKQVIVLHLPKLKVRITINLNHFLVYRD